jgi:protein-S-isoprenylcysteine O-methyltransferase Ste14
MMWVGLALRVWAVLTLGRSFSTFIQVDADQAVVTRGPYRGCAIPPTAACC